MPAKESDKEALSRADLLGEAPAAPVAAPETDAVLEAAIEAEVGEAVTAKEEPRLHPILTNDEYRAAIERAKKRVEEDAKKEALKHVEAQAYDEMRGKRGIRTGDPQKDELVEITMDLPEFTDRITINGFVYFHTKTYTVPRHIADSLRDIQWRAWLHDNEINGKGIADRGRLPRNTIFNAKSGAVINGPMAA